MNITTQIIYEVLLSRARLAPHLLEYLKPFFLLAVALGIYWFFGVNSILQKILLLGVYIGACWMLIQDIREASHLALGYILRLRAGTMLRHALPKRASMSANIDTPKQFEE